MKTNLNEFYLNDKILDEKNSGLTLNYLLKGNDHVSIAISKVKDVIDSKKILLNNPLVEHQNEFSDSYSVSDDQGNILESCYVIILKNNQPSRLLDALKLVGKKSKFFTNVLSVEIVEFSDAKKRSLCILIEKPKGVSFEKYIEKKGSLEEFKIAYDILPPIIKAINFLSSNGVTHGSINPKNIYIDNHQHIVVSQCFSELCGYSQEPIYEPVDIATTSAVGKRSDDVRVDYYALGVFAVYLNSSRKITKELSLDQIIEMKFQEGTYNFITKNLKFDLYFQDFLRGVINDNLFKIWDKSKINRWSQGKVFNLLSPINTAVTNRPIVFKDVTYYNYKYFSYILYKNWEEAKKFIYGSEILRWVDANKNYINNAKNFKFLVSKFSTTSRISQSSNLNADIVLMKVLLIIDPEAPIRYKNFSLYINSLGNLLSYYYIKDIESYNNTIFEIIQSGIHLFIRENSLSSKYGYNKDDLSRLGKLNFYLKKNTLGFGKERCFYESNYGLSCQSPLFGGNFIFSEKECLLALENHPDIQSLVIDSHVICFLSKHLDLLVDIFFPQLSAFPRFANESQITKLCIIANAQRLSQIRSLSNLTNRFKNKFQEMFLEYLVSKSLRKKLIESLSKVSEEGDLSKLLKFIISNKFLYKNKYGFISAKEIYKNNAINILHLADRKASRKFGYILSLKLSVIFSFLLSSFVFIILVIRYF